MNKRSSKEIIKILQSITNVSIEDGELDTWFEDCHFAESIHSFQPDSFTRKLLELIKEYLSEEISNDEKNP